MPAPASAVPWTDVETMIKAGIGVRETARRLGLSEERVKRMATRRGWAPQSPAAKLDAAQAALQVVRNEVCPHVPTAADALAKVLREAEETTKLGLARGIARASQLVEQQDPATTYETADKLKALTGSAATVFRWSDTVQQSVRLSIYTGSADVQIEESPVVDV